MDGFLRQSTASQTRGLGPFLDDTDFKTAETGLTIANTDIKISKGGGSSVSKNSGGGTHDVNGKYLVTWDATDTATVGSLEYTVKMTGALPVFGTYVVLEEAVYDALMAASAPGYVTDQPVNATKVGGTSQTGRDLGASVLLSVGTGTGQVNLSSGAVPVTGDLTATMKTSVTTAATAATPAAASVTGNVGGSVASIASGGITAASFAADSITAAKLASDVTTEIQSGLATASALSTAQSGITSIKAKTDNLPASPAAVSDIPTAAANADAVWDEVLSGHLTSGTTGAGLNAAGSAGDPWATTLPGSYGAGTAGKIVGDNLDAPVSGVGGGGGLDAAGVRSALGMASANMDTQLANISGDVDGLGTLLAAADADIEDIKAVTDLLPNAGALTSLATAAAVTTLTGYVDTEVAAIKSQTDKLTFNAGNEVAVSLESINGSELKGDGSSIPWGKA